MRVLIALALTVALLAGCVDPEPRDAATGTPTPTHSESTNPPGTGGNNGFAVQQGTAHGSNQGIEVDVTWRACEEGFCANATATNRGTATVQVSSICEPPWTERMTHDGEEVAHKEPEAHCLAFGRMPFAPGDSRQRDFTWDGQLHDQAVPYDAPEGSYTWTLAFWWDDGQGSARQEAAADIHLVIGET